MFLTKRYHLKIQEKKKKTSSSLIIVELCKNVFVFAKAPQGSVYARWILMRDVFSVMNPNEGFYYYKIIYLSLLQDLCVKNG